VKAVLTYHSIDDSGSVISVSQAELARQLDDLRASGATIVPLEKIHALPDDASAVAITFDDGFRNFAELAVPVLGERQMPATVFIVADYVGSSNDWESKDSRAAVPALPLMTWSELRSVGPDIQLGAHGLSHRSLRGLDPSLLEKEITGCTAKMELELGQKPSAFAFPYGDFDDASLAAVGRHFSVACTTEFSVLSGHSNPHAIPRLDSFYFQGSSRLRRFGSREFAAWVQIRRVARTARRRLTEPLG